MRNMLLVIGLMFGGISYQGTPTAPFEAVTVSDPVKKLALLFCFLRSRPTCASAHSRIPFQIA
jgi:hypothetical protein